MADGPTERLYLIRHGRPSGGWGGADPDPGLDAVGLEQAAAAASWLMALPADERPLRVVSSPMRRCLETAAPFAEALGAPVEIDPSVGEIPTPSALSGDQRSAWLRDAMSGEWGQIVGDLDYEAWRRSVAAAVARRSRTAVFSHFVAINAVVSLVRGEDRVIGYRPDHASITTLGIGESGLRVIELGPEARTEVL
jgi:broad specificity phosphatase PhoE